MFVDFDVLVQEEAENDPIDLKTNILLKTSSKFVDKGWTLEEKQTVRFTPEVAI